MKRRELLEALEYVRTIDEDIPIQTLSVFLYISLHAPECRQSELTEWLGMAQSTVSRNISYLRKRNRLGKPGMGLVESVESQEDRRYKVLRLTPKGEKLSRILEHYEAIDATLKLADKREALAWNNSEE